MKSHIHRAIALLAFGLAAWTLSVSAQSFGHWVTNTKFAPLPETAEEYWSATANGKFYLVGGTAVNEGDASRTFLPGRMLEYDPGSDKWTAKKKMPRPANHMNVAEYKGKIYVFGGTGTEKAGEAGPGNYQLNDSWEYDPAADSWKALAPAPTRRNAAAAVAAGGKIYVMGGNQLAEGAANPGPGNNQLVVGTNEAYDPATNKWETRQAMPTPRNHPAIGEIGGKIYVIGGRIGAPNVANFIASATDVVEEYDPATDKWRAMTKMPTPRSGQGWATYQNRIYVVGGEWRDYHMDAIFRDVEAFDPATNQWFRMPPMDTARHGVNVSVVGNRMYVIGGHVAFDGTAAHNADTGIQEVWEFGGK
jgi:N-acetylneuraminic acid mutarotase